MQAQREAQLDPILSEPSLDATTPATMKNHSRADSAFQLVFWCVKVISFNITAGAYASSHSWQNAVACLQADRKLDLGHHIHIFNVTAYSFLHLEDLPSISKCQRRLRPERPVKLRPSWFCRRYAKTFSDQHRRRSTHL